MPKSLVTGASGFLGGYVVNGLVSRGEHVRALVRTTSTVSNLQQPGVELVTGDLTDEDSLVSAVQGIEQVFHCAAYCADWGTWETYQSANVTGLQILLRVLAGSRVKRLIHVSTSGVYGHPNVPVDESFPYRFRGFPYLDTKIIGEELVWDFYQQYQIPTSIIRPASIYGPGSTVTRIIADLLVSGSMLLIGHGDTTAGLAYVSNVADLMLLAAESNSSIGQAYNASDGMEVTWRQYACELARILGVREPRIQIPYRLAYATGWIMEKAYRTLRIRDRPLLTRHVVGFLGTEQGFPIDKARKDLGFVPAVSFHEGMERISAWLHEEGYF